MGLFQLEGWVTKKATSSIFKKSWKRRLLRLTLDVAGNWMLTYHASPSAPPKKAALDISAGSTVTSSDEHASVFPSPAAEFCVTLGDGKTLFAVIEPRDAGLLEDKLEDGASLPSGFREVLDGMRGTNAASTRDSWVAAIGAAIASLKAEDAAGASASSVDATGASASSVDATGASASSVDATGASASSVDATGASASSVDATGASASSVDAAGRSESPEPSARKPRLPPPPPGLASGRSGARAAASARAASTTRRRPTARRVSSAPTRELAPALGDIEARVLGSGSGAVDRLVGTHQPRAKSLSEVVKELRRRKARLMTVGGNEAGQLAGGTINASGSAEAQAPKSLAGRYMPASIAAGETHAACLTVGGSVMVWGDGSSGQLGVGAAVEQSARPYLLKPLRAHRAVSVACGAQHTLVALEDGRVFSFGDGSGWGELGVGRRVASDEPVPIEGLPAEDGPYSVFAGRITSGVVDASGGLRMWGCNAAGQCGVEEAAGADDFALLEPARVEIESRATPGPARVVTAAAADFFTLLVVGEDRQAMIVGVPTISRADREGVLSSGQTEARRILSETWDSAGAAEHGDGDGDGGGASSAEASAACPPPWRPRPAFISRTSGLSAARAADAAAAGELQPSKPLKAVLDVAAGARHGAAVRATGGTYVIGRGVLGLPSSSAALKRSAEAGAATADAQEETEAADWWVCTPDFEEVTSLGLEGVAAVSCGSDHTVVGTRTGRLISFGFADVAQTGTGAYGWTFTPSPAAALAEPMSHCEAFAAGGRFTMALLYPGSRGEARARELAVVFGDAWMRRTLGRGLGETKTDEAEARAAIDGLASELISTSGLSEVVAGGVEE